MGFNFPHPPDQLVYPETAQTWAEIVAGGILLGYVVWGAIEWQRTRSLLLFVLLLGGAIAYFNEPFDDVLGLVWFPRPNQDVALETLGPVPLWGLFTYAVFFGGSTYAFLRLLQWGKFTLRWFWLGVLAYFVLDLAIEIVAIKIGLYAYYGYGGDVPMQVGGFPLYWMLINVPGPVLCAAILFCAPDYFRGWRAPAVALLPLVTYSGTAVAVGLPIYSTLHAPDATTAIRWGAALLSIAIGLFILDGLSRLILARTKSMQDEAVPAMPAMAAPVVSTEVRDGVVARG